MLVEIRLGNFEALRDSVKSCALVTHLIKEVACLLTNASSLEV
jgi:hypothetical protein